MRKIVLFVAVLLFMTVPAMAAKPANVTISCADDDINMVIVSYATDGNLIRAFGLDINVVGANITKLDVVDANYRIYPGQISIVGGEVSDYGTPYALSDLGDANVTIEMGSLYTEDPCYSPAHGGDPNMGYGKKPTQSGTLLKFYVGGACNYTITENAIRGGIVMEDPCEVPNVTLCSGSVVVGCTVPNVLNMTPDAAKAALEAAGLVADGNTCIANATGVGDGNVASTTPAIGSTVSCGTSVSKVIVECYCGMTDYAQWVEVNKPTCWCYPRQCHGDADGQKEGTSGKGYNYVGTADLDIMSLGWLVKDPTKGPGILDLEVNGVPVACADFKHNKEGTSGKGYSRIGTSDLDEMSLYWLVKEPTKGTGTPPNCDPNNRTP
jgi:hypothetical protein